MKSYEEIAKNVFRRRDEYIEKKNKRIAIIKKCGTAMSVLCVTVLFGLAVYGGRGDVSDTEDNRNEIQVSFEGYTTASSETAHTVKTGTDISIGTGDWHESAASVTTATTAAPKHTVTETAYTERDASYANIGVLPAVSGTAASTAVSLPAASASTDKSTAFSAATAITTTTTTITTAAAITQTTNSVQDNNSSGLIWSIHEKDSESDSVYIDRSKLADGDYTFRAGIYFNSDNTEPLYVSSIAAQWDGFDSSGSPTGLIRFANIISNQDILQSSCAYTPDSKVIYSAGPYKISFTDNNGTERICEVVWDEATGDAVTTEVFEEYTRNGVPQSIVIEDYDPDIEAGTPIPAAYRNIIAFDVTESIDVNTACSPLVTFDVLIDECTPAGTYYIGFDNGQFNQWCYMGKLDAAGGVVYANNLAPLSDVRNKYGYPEVKSNDKDCWLRIIVE